MRLAKQFRQQIANRPQLLLIVAAVWHLGAATAIYEAGKHQFLPNQIFPSGIGKFASDGFIYEKECIELREALRSQGLRAWFTWPTQLHVRLYSLPFALSRTASFNILTIEPLNLIYYLGILTLVFQVGRILFDRTSGLVATSIIAAWPSLVLHSTQLLRDPLLILAVLVLSWVVIVSLTQNTSWLSGLLYGLIGVVALILIRIVRLPMWRLVLAALLLAIALLILKMIVSRQVMVGATILGLLLVAGLIIVPRFQSSFRSNQEVKIKRLTRPEDFEVFSTERQLAMRRKAFEFHVDEEGNFLAADDGSRIDRDVQFHSVIDIIEYLPRATMIGFLAPFPNMWLAVGKQVGSSGRYVSGFEMLATYVLECFALISLWLQRRRYAAWFLFALTAMGTIALGTVANNIGALYRLRYPFWVMIVIFGAGGLVHMLRHKFSKRAFAKEVS